MVTIITDKFLIGLSETLANNRQNVSSSYAFFRAAVLIPLVIKQGEIEVMFEVRSQHLGWQPGEICFPGGRIESTDATPVVAAIRETTEELGIVEEQIKIMGVLDEIVSPIGVMLYPAVGMLEMGELTLNRAEVAEVFTVPLQWLIQAEPKKAIMEMGTRPLKGFPFELIPDYPKEWKARTTYPVLFYQYERYNIWGLTAHVLAKFLTIMKSFLEKS